MKLSEWIAAERLKRYEVAVRLGLSQMMYLSGAFVSDLEKTPSMAVATRIYIETAGRVTYEDLATP